MGLSACTVDFPAVSTTTTAPSTTSSSSTTTTTTTQPETSTTTLPVSTTTTEPPRSLEELARSVLLVAPSGTTLTSDEEAFLAAGGRAMVLLPQNIGDAEQTTTLTGAIACASSDSVIVATRHGVVIEDRTLTGLVEEIPSRDEALALFAVDLAYIGEGLGHEMVALGINLDLAPDLNTPPTTDHEAIGSFAFAFIAGLQRARVAAVPGDFPGTGRSRNGRVAEAIELLDELDWIPFRAAVAAGVPAIVMAAAEYPAISDGPLALSEAGIRLMRDRLEFDGAAISPPLSELGPGDPGDLAVAALVAGNDLLFVDDVGTLDLIVTAIIDAVDAGVLDRDRLEEAALRVDALALFVAPLPCRN